MIFITIVILIAWVVSIVGWLNEDRYRRKLLDIISEDIKSEIRWIKLNGEADLKCDEINAYKNVIRILNKYNNKEDQE